jgi:hypothetical protein
VLLGTAAGFFVLLLSVAPLLVELWELWVLPLLLLLAPLLIPLLPLWELTVLGLLPPPLLRYNVLLPLPLATGTAEEEEDEVEDEVVAFDIICGAPKPPAAERTLVTDEPPEVLVTPEATDPTVDTAVPPTIFVKLPSPADVEVELEVTSRLGSTASMTAR